MSNDYDASLDIGIAVKEDPAKMSAKKKKKHRKRKRSISEASESSTISKEYEMHLDGIHTNVANTSGGKAKKKKKKKKRKTLDSVEASVSDETPMLERKPKKNEITMPPLRGNYLKERCNLPVYQHRNGLCTLVNDNDVVLVVAETVSKVIYIVFISYLYQTKMNSNTHRAAENPPKYQPTSPKAAYSKNPLRQLLSHPILKHLIENIMVNPSV
jgi:hypothetical protein